MAQANREKPDKNKPKRLASINFPSELLEWLDCLVDEIGINRSSAVVFILEEFRRSGNTIKTVVVQQHETDKRARLAYVEADKRRTAYVPAKTVD